MPAELHSALVKAWRRKERRKDERAAIIAQAVRNSAGGKGHGQGYAVEDFIGEFEE